MRTLTTTGTRKWDRAGAWRPSWVFWHRTSASHVCGAWLEESSDNWTCRRKSSQLHAARACPIKWPWLDYSWDGLYLLGRWLHYSEESLWAGSEKSGPTTYCGECSLLATCQGSYHVEQTLISAGKCKQGMPDAEISHSPYFQPYDPGKEKLPWTD